MVDLDNVPCHRVFDHYEEIWAHSYKNTKLSRWMKLHCGPGPITAKCDGVDWLCLDCYRRLGYEW